MILRARAIVPLLVVAGTLAACGSRTTLLEGSGGATAGAGGGSVTSGQGGDASSTASATATATSSAVSSGSGVLCNLWDMSGSWISKPWITTIALAPHLVQETGSPDKAELVYLTDPGGVTPSPFLVLEADFTAWESGFLDQDLLFAVYQFTSVPTDLAVGKGRLPGTHSVQTQESDSVLALYAAVPTDAMPIPGGVLTPIPPNVALRPVFVGQREHTSPNDPAELLQGFERTEEGKSRLSVRLISPKWGDVLHGQSVACANSPVVAAANGWQDKFLVAAASSRPPGKCDDPADPLGAPTQVQVSFYHLPIGDVIQPIIDFDAATPVTFVDTFPAGEDPMNDGAWVVYGTSPTPSSFVLRVNRFNAAGKLLVTPFDVPAGALELPRFVSATRLGDQLALAWPEPSGPGLALHIAVFDRSGAMVTTFAMVPPSMTGATILGSPDGKQLLAAFTDADGAGQVIRYGCR